MLSEGELIRDLAFVQMNNWDQLLRSMDQSKNDNEWCIAALKMKSNQFTLHKRDHKWPSITQYSGATLQKVSQLGQIHT